ncbi:hypothetical protein [uncultured Neptuniibacter sp.]|uniref:hypothetical protein n=1 Tax=uncultured Neptuniibacter sp. TaxID=502143 RepID=UPI0026154C4A|nr:hypothetical protein [uncultured Neptuniibacter sp.]
MRKLIVLLTAIILTSPAYSAGFKTEAETRKFADSLMDHFIRKDFQGGLNGAKPYWPIPDVEVDGLANKIQQQWPIVDQRFGAAIAKEFIKSKRIGNSFLRYYYLHKFENHAIYWQIDFYKPHNEWKLNTMIFLDNLEPLYK